MTKEVLHLRDAVPTSKPDVPASREHPVFTPGHTPMQQPQGAASKRGRPNTRRRQGAMNRKAPTQAKPAPKLKPKSWIREEAAALYPSTPWSGGGGCCVVWWCSVVCSLFHGGGGIVAGPVGGGGCSCLAVGRCGAADYGPLVFPPVFPWSVGRVGSLWCGARVPAGRRAWGRSVATSRPWSCLGVLAQGLVGPGAR